MKHTIILALLLITALSGAAQLTGVNGQGVNWRPRPKIITNYYRCDAIISNDTLYITDSSHITTIKIGDKFYKVVKHEPTIEEEIFKPAYRTFQFGNVYPNNANPPAGGGGSGTVR